MRLRDTLLYLIIFLEGYVVLSYELISLKMMKPFFGSSIPITAIVIAAVLLPLALGYHSGGRFKPSYGKSIRQKIFINFAIASFFIAFGSSYEILSKILLIYYDIGVTHYLGRVGLHVMLFVVPAVYLLGQTIPLLTHYFRQFHPTKTTAMILYISTIGSLAGSLVTTLVLMDWIGAEKTIIVTLSLLPLSLITLNPLKHKFLFLLCLSMLASSVYLNSEHILGQYQIVKNNAYHMIQVIPKNSANDEDIPRILRLDHGSASMYNPVTGKKADYIEYVEDRFLDTLPSGYPPIDILALGSGGFSFGLEDKKNNFTFVDIDKNIKDIAETYFLKQKLDENKNFVVMPLRAYLNETDKKFDLIFLDADSVLTLQEHLVTIEFFNQIKSRLKDNGIFVSNFVGSPDFNTLFSQNLYATFSSVFWPNSHIILHKSDPWGIYANDGSIIMQETLFIYINRNANDAPEIYTDMKNTSSRHYLQKKN